MNQSIKSAKATKLMTNAMIINTSFPAAKTESPRNEKNGCLQFGDL